MPVARGHIVLPDHMPCQCGHLGWRHWPDTGHCARCPCTSFQQQHDERHIAPPAVYPIRISRHRTLRSHPTMDSR